MGKILLSVILGLFIGGAGCYFLITPKAAEKSYNLGLEKGTSEGMVQGIAQVKLEQKKYQDSIDAVTKKQAETRPKVRKQKVQKEPVDNNNRNFHWNANGVWEEIK
jgi:hypothetical protein